MRLAIVCLFCLNYALAAKYCGERSVISYFKKPIYEFSNGFADRVSQETDGHFVCSPIAAWLQLVNLADGAQGISLKQISKVTGRSAKPCMQRTLRKILNNVTSELKSKYKTQSVVLVDKLLDVKRNFKRKLEQLSTVKVAALNFDSQFDSANKANRIIEDATGISNTMDPGDFNATELLLADVSTFKSAWNQPFDPAYTNKEPFYYNDIKGETNMMFQTGYFKYTKIDRIHAEILELPCVNDKYSMLIFLNTEGNIKDLYFNMKEIRLATIFNLFSKSKSQLVNVKLPRFKIKTEIENLPELVNDMGVSFIFNPAIANLKGISKYQLQVNGMKQVVNIEVTEEGVSADVAQSLIDKEGHALDFTANRPFGFMLVDKQLEIMLFAGVYSIPTLF